MAVTNRYVWGPNLVGGTPMSPHPKGMSYVLGAAPHAFTMGLKAPPGLIGEVHKVALGPLQPRPTHTPSRRCAPCSLASFHFFFRELPLLSRRSRCCSLLIQLEAASFYRRSASPSPLRGHACSLKASAQRTRVWLVPGSMPAHADPCGDNVSFTG